MIARHTLLLLITGCSTLVSGIPLRSRVVVRRACLENVTAPIITLPDENLFEIWLPPDYQTSSPTPPFAGNATRPNATARRHQQRKQQQQPQKWPLILSFHGGGGTIAHQMSTDRLTNKALNKDHIVVYLQAAEEKDEEEEGRGNRADTRGYWLGSPEVDPGNTSQLDLVKQVLDYVAAEFPVDMNRVYATGFSQGGGFVNRLACDRELSTRFAAFAPVSGAYYIPLPNSDNSDDGQEDDQDGNDGGGGGDGSGDGSETCRPKTIAIPCGTTRTDTPIFAVHGGADGTISYTGGTRKGQCLPDVQHFIKKWAARDGLSPEPASVEDIQTENADGDGAKLYSFGEDQRVMLMYAGDGVGHEWPTEPSQAGGEGGGGEEEGIDATRRIMDFFRRHSLE